MLLPRILTSLLLAPLVLWLFIASRPAVFEAVLLFVILLGAWEWTRLMGIKSVFKKILYLFFIIVLMLITAGSTHTQAIIMLTIAICWWLIVALWVFRYPKSKVFWQRPLVLIILGSQVFVPTWFALSALRSLPQGVLLVTGLLVLIWGADVGAYIAGRLYGKHFLIPEVSPKKTWEGVLGGVSVSLLIAGVWGGLLNIPLQHWIVWMMLVVVTVFASINGDLLISMLKRSQGLKDSGRMLPGHGGLLDRIDSVLGATPVFLFGWLVLKALPRWFF